MSRGGPLQFAVFRIALGSLVGLQLIAWWPWIDELFPGRPAGAPAGAGLGALFPSPLAFGPSALPAFLAVLVVLAVAFALGWARRACALGLWYGWTALGHASPLVLTVASAFVGWLLLASALVPPGEPLRPGRRRQPGGGEVPRALTVGAWIVLAAGYGLSGLDKLGSPAWRSGDALAAAMGLPYARDLGAAAVLSLAPPLQHLATWTGLAIELGFPALALWRRTRPLAWASGAGLQLGLLALFAFPGLTVGMLLMHVFTFDPAWLPRRFAPARGPETPGQGARDPEAIAETRRETALRAVRDRAPGRHRVTRAAGRSIRRSA